MVKEDSFVFEPDPKRGNYSLGGSFGGPEKSNVQLTKAQSFIEKNNYGANVYLVGETLHMQTNANLSPEDVKKLHWDLAKHLEFGYPKHDKNPKIYEAIFNRGSQ